MITQKPLQRFLASLILAFAVAGSGTAQQRIKVRDYGAIPNDSVNDIDQIRAAIGSLPTNDAVLEFEYGVYDLKPLIPLGAPSPRGANKKVIFQIFSKTNLTVEGNGATLRCHDFDPTRGFNGSYYDLFYFWGCTDLQVQDLIVKMSRPPFSVGTCTGITYTPLVPGRSFQVALDQQFMTPGINMQNMMIHALVNWRAGAPNGQEFLYVQQDPPIPNGSDFYVSTIAGTNLTIKGFWTLANNIPSGPGYDMMNQLPNPAAQGFPALSDYGKLHPPMAGTASVPAVPGDEVIIIHQFSYYIAFSFAACTGSFLTNLTVYTWPGMAVNMLRDQDVVIDGLQVVPNPQNPLPLTTTTDAIHLVNMSGTIDVSNCHLEGMGDDGFNCYTKLLEATDEHSEDWSIVCKATGVDRGWTFAQGSTWEFYDTEMRPMGTRTQLGVSFYSSATDNHHLNFTAPIPSPEVNIAYLCNLSEFPSSLSFTGTTVTKNRGNGLKLRRNSTVTACNFDTVSAQGIVIGASVGFWDEGPSTKSILVENSTFESCNRGWGLAPYHEGAISIATDRYNPGLSPFWDTGPVGSIEGVTLRNLVINGSGGAAVSARSGNGITIDSCVFSANGDLAGVLGSGHPNGAGLYAASSLLFFHEAGDISITGNEVMGSLVFGDRSWPLLYGYYTKTGNVGF